MLILALTRKGQESFNGQVPRDDEPEPTSSSSSQESLSCSAEFASSSSEANTGIQPTRLKMQNKEVRGTVNAKGARVNPNNKANYQVDFNF